MDGSPPLVSLIVPCYNEGPGLASFLERVRDQIVHLPAYRFELLFIDDGSTDDTREVLHVAATRDSWVKVVRLSRNFGHQRAITAGIDFARGDYHVVLDADLQDPPACLPEMLEKLAEGWDVVHMVRCDRRVDSWAKRTTAALFYALMRRWVLPELPADAGDFKGFSRRAAETLKRYPERVRFTRGLFASMGYRQTSLSYTRADRFQGRSKYRWRNVLRLARDAVVSNTVLPLRAGLYTGIALVFVVSPIFFLLLFVRWWLGLEQSSLVLVVLGVQLLLGGLVLTFLGIVGEYLKVLMLEVKQRPQYLVAELENLGDD